MLRREEIEYELADRLLCPSEFVAGTFVDEGYPRAKLARHVYGYDPERVPPCRASGRPTGEGLKLLFVGVCAVRKGLHFALEAWLRLPGVRDGHLLDRRRVPARRTPTSSRACSTTRACGCSVTGPTCRS